MSIQVTLQHRRRFQAQYHNAKLKMQQQQQKHGSVVNHIVKNALVDVDLGLSLLQQTPVAQHTAEMLESIRAVARRGFRWCKNYQVGVDRPAGGSAREAGSEGRQAEEKILGKEGVRGGGRRKKGLRDGVRERGSEGWQEEEKRVERWCEGKRE